MAIDFPRPPFSIFARGKVLLSDFPRSVGPFMSLSLFFLNTTESSPELYMDGDLDRGSPYMTSK